MKRPDSLLVRDMLECCQFIGGHIAGLEREALLQRLQHEPAFQAALCHWLLLIGEAAGQLSDSFRAEHDRMPWRDIKAMRNYLVHVYYRLDWEVLVDSALYDVPELQAYMEKILLK